MNPLDRWATETEGDSPYTVLAGFENELCARSETLDAMWSNIDIYEQIELFAFVMDLICRASESGEASAITPKGQEVADGVEQETGATPVLNWSAGSTAPDGYIEADGEPWTLQCRTTKSEPPGEKEPDPPVRPDSIEGVKARIAEYENVCDG